MSSALGKRKDRGDDVSENKSHGSTLFVSNLPYSATSTDINTLFSDLGPVRSAFVVLDQSSGSSKGVGYVSFSIREDAELAFEKVNENGEGLVLDGRRLRAQWADSKHMKDKQPEGDQVKVKKEEKIQKPSRPPQPSASRDPLAIRTIVISGLPPSVDSKALWKKIRKYAGAEKVDWPLKVGDNEDHTMAHVIFKSPATAQEAVTKLHAHVFKGALLSVTLKKRLDGLAKPSKKPVGPPTAKTAPSNVETKVAKVAAPSRANRLIVRNLPFDVTEQDLRAVFLPYGPIHSIHIPLKEAEAKDENAEEPSKPRVKGYAFVWMLSRKDAERAVEGANGQKVRAGMADELVRDKQKRKKLRREEAKIREREKARKLARKARGEGDGDSDDEETGGKDADGSDAGTDEEIDEATTTERVIAVDWALSKDKWEEVKAKMEEEGPESDGEGDHQRSMDGSDDEDSHLGVHDGSDSDMSSEATEDEGHESMDVDQDAEQHGKPQLPPPETGTTLFVRNVPFEATDDELRTVFRAFGPLRYARITFDRETGRSRGTGFACFWNKDDADKAIAQSEILRNETTGGETSAAPKRNPFKLPSLLTPDPSASIAQNLVLHGRTMDVIRAVTRDEAGKLKEAGERQREKADKRNLYLLREGIILPNTPAAEGLNIAEVEKRTQSYNARRALLRSNPSLYVSKTRLSVRSLPLFATERMLKRLAFHAVRAFESEVKEGARSGLTEDELAVVPDEHRDEGETGNDEPKAKGKQKQRKHGRSTGVKQAKIVRQQDRVDPVTGKGRSKGYGFLEMEKHADALRVLRWANNNAEVGTLLTGWWKEELGDLIKIEKKKEKKEEGRLERLKDELEQGQPKKAKSTLIVEFSIENVQVVRRRTAHQQEARLSSTDSKKNLRLPQVKQEEEKSVERPRKKPRTSDASLHKEEDREGKQLGSLIGRKRKERKGKKRAA